MARPGIPLLMLLVVAGQAGAQQIPVRQIAVVTSFGGLSADPHAELLQVRRVMMTGDGRFVVANGQPAAVRVFDARGRFQREVGRGGAGPGEFRGAVDIRPWRGDSVLTYSSGTRRWMLYNLDGTLVREWPADSTHPYIAGMVLANGRYVRQVLFGSRGCVWGVLLRFPAPGRLTFAEGLVDGNGRVWRQDFTDSTLWHIHDPDGQEVARVRLAAGLRIQQFQGGVMVGVRADPIGADQVEMYRLPLPPVQGPAPKACTVPPPSPATRVQAIHARNAVSAGEAYRSDFGRYPASLEQLVSMLKVTEESAFTFLRSDEDGWAFAVSNLATGGVCVGSAGVAGLPGWEPGAVACTATGGVTR